MLYCHGGGYLIGSPEQFSKLIKKFIEKRPCVVIAPDYRKSTEAPYPAALNDCYDTLLWMKENANAIGADNENFIVAGHSAGGGLTAAITLKARDTNDVNIAFQMPIYPMIDDRQSTESSKYMGIPMWDAKTNALGWKWYLKNLKLQNIEIPAYAAPARNTDYSNFPPTISFVGGVEPFRDETLQYVDALNNANIPVEFKLYEGCFHSFELAAPNSEIGKEALDFTFESYAKFYDRYCQ
jgi:acetyl esterase/lipase